MATWPQNGRRGQCLMTPMTDDLDPPPSDFIYAA